jgi:hypothetical protein
MTTAEKSELDRAIERAQRNGVKIVARGHLKSSGTRYFETNGNAAQRNHEHGMQYGQASSQGEHNALDTISRAFLLGCCMLLSVVGPTGSLRL